MLLYATLTDKVSETLCPDLMLPTISRLSEYRQLLINYHRQINADLGNIPSHENTAEIVQAHQIGLSELSNILFAFKKLLEDDHPDHQLLARFYTDAAREFDALLGFIIKEYAGFVNPKLQAPYSYVSQVSAGLVTIIEQVMVQARIKKLDPVVIALVLKPVKEIIAPKENRVSLWSLSYCQEMLKSLLSVTAPEASDKEIYYLLIHLNFNYYEYYLYCIRRLQSKLERQKDDASRIEMLNTYERKIRIHPVKRGFAFHPDEASWAEQMLTHMEEEKRSISDKIVVTVPVTEEKEEGETEENMAAEITKLNTSLTVYELAFMVRLYIDVGIITNASPTVVMEFITQFLTTKNTDSLAMSSFKNKYYKPTLATMRNCKQWLKKLQDKLPDYE